MVGGAGHYLFPELVESPIPLTCSKPCFGTAGAEHALAAMLLFSRRIHHLRRPPMTQWDPGRDGELQPFDLAGKTVGIIGLGYMGRTIARVCSSLGMRVLGTARRPRRRVDSVDELFSADRLPELLSAADFVVLAVPLTGETRSFMGRSQLRTMKPSAYLIDSSGRPPLFDYAALERALEEEMDRRGLPAAVGSTPGRPDAGGEFQILETSPGGGDSLPGHFQGAGGRCPGPVLSESETISARSAVGRVGRQEGRVLTRLRIRRPAS